MIYGSMNRGDWGEIYTLIYLLGSRVLCSADENLCKVVGADFPIIKSIRDENIPEPTAHVDHIEFNLTGVNDVEIYFNSTLVRTISSADFQAEAIALCRDIPDDATHISLGNGKFNIPHGEAFINSIYCKRLAAASNDITDLRLVLHDIVSGSNREVGFSVKSYLGGAPTLLNASEATNFVYRVHGVSDAEMTAINAISSRNKIIDRLNRIHAVGGSLEYCCTANIAFSQNLRKMDGDMERILAEALVIYYKDNIKKCPDVVSELERTDPLTCGISGMYEYKFKRFLCAKALGLEPSKVWSGEDDANGGYIVAKSDGEVLAFHLYDRDKFKRYLLDSTHFEKGSTSKHKFATIYQDSVTSEKFIKLNLQIRFN